MNYQQTTQLPNEVVDVYLSILSGAEFKLLTLIIRQTYGWITKTGARKKRDRMTYGYIEKKTRLSRRIIAQALDRLSELGVVQITDYDKNILTTPEQRKGKTSIYYAPIFKAYEETSQNTGKKVIKDVQKGIYNKTNFSKLTIQKIESQGTKRLTDAERIQQILNEREQNN